MSFWLSSWILCIWLWMGTPRLRHQLYTKRSEVVCVNTAGRSCPLMCLRKLHEHCRRLKNFEVPLFFKFIQIMFSDFRKDKWSAVLVFGYGLAGCSALSWWIASKHHTSNSVGHFVRKVRWRYAERLQDIQRQFHQAFWARPFARIFDSHVQSIWKEPLFCWKESNDC